MHPPPLDDALPDADALIVTPDEADVFAADLRGKDGVDLEEWPQHGGRKAYRVSLGAPGKPHAFFSRPHAHEPAGTAACFEAIRRLLEAETPWARWALKNFRLSFLPDANPSGSQRAPVKFWDGKQMPNERFFLWMFGESGEEAGERFPRVPCWDSREVEFPALVGIAYEQLNEHTYVEPNRDRRSTFFRAFAALHQAEPVDLWLDLHQTEYVGSERNCHINLPLAFDELPAAVQKHYRALGEEIHARWRRLGATPYDQPAVPYRNNPEQSRFLRQAAGDLVVRTYQLITEVQNNNPRTSVQTQVQLQLAAMDQALRYLYDHAADMKKALE